MLLSGFRKAIALGLLLSAVSGASLIHKGQAKQSVMSEKFGRYTASQILDCAFALRPLLNLDTEIVQISVQPGTLFYRGGIRERHWCADYLGRGGSELARVEWDANTGCLCFLAKDTYSLPPGYGTPLAASECLPIAHPFLDLIDTSDAGERWRLEGHPEMTHHFWSLRWRNGNRTAFMLIDACTGHLTFLRIQQERKDRSGPDLL